MPVLISTVARLSSTMTLAIRYSWTRREWKTTAPMLPPALQIEAVKTVSSPTSKWKTNMMSTSETWTKRSADLSSLSYYHPRLLWDGIRYYLPQDPRVMFPPTIETRTSTSEFSQDGAKVERATRIRARNGVEMGLTYITCYLLYNSYQDYRRISRRKRRKALQPVGQKHCNTGLECIRLGSQG